MQKEASVVVVVVCRSITHLELYICEDCRRNRTMEWEEKTIGSREISYTHT